MLPLLALAAMMPARADDRGRLEWPKPPPYDSDKEKRYAAERIEAARLKRERKAAKRAQKT